MLDTRIAKLFKNGASQAVRLPADFRFEGVEVYVTRDDATGDILLSNQPGAKAWGDFFQLLHYGTSDDDFMSERPLNVPTTTPGVFDNTDADNGGEAA